MVMEPTSLTPSLLRTALNVAHRDLGARMVDFAGWEMPVQYKSIIAEHNAVRTRAGLFDVSHMGRIRVEGLSATSFLDGLITCDIAGLRTGRARYGLLCDEHGGILDDLVTIRLADDAFLVVCNAANWDRVLEWLQGHATGAQVHLTPQRDETAMLALQGPAAREVLTPFCSYDVSGLRRFAAVPAVVNGVEALVSRTGYTGEDGFELVMDAAEAHHVWDTFIQDRAVEPCGLGARDTLRLEAGLLLHGQDMDLTTTPLEAGLERFVALNKEFVGAEALRRQAKEGVSRRLAGFRMEGRASPRHGYTLFTGNGVTATVTSGSFSPTLQHGIGLAYLPVEQTTPGTAVQVDIRGKMTSGEVVPLPFYRRQD